MTTKPLPRTPLLLALALPCALPAPAAARAIDLALEVTVLVTEGDSVPGVGQVTWFQDVVVHRGGETLVRVGTDHPDPAADEVVLRNGVVHLRDGTPLAAPAGATIGSFDSFGLTDSGGVAWNAALANTAGPGDDSAVFWNAALLLQEGATVAAAGVPPGTILSRFWEVATPDGDTVLVNASFDVPTLPGNLNAALLRVDPATGAQTLVAMEGQAAPGLPGAALSFFSDAPGTFDLNDAGDVLFYADTDLPAGTDGVIYRGPEILAREGTPSIVPGRNWDDLAGPSVSLNGDGDAAFTARLAGDFATRAVIVKGDTKWVQAGDALPATGGSPLTFFGSGPLRLADRGEAADDDPDLLWYGRWSDPHHGSTAALFLNDKPLLRSSADTLLGQPISTVFGLTRSYSMSPDGRYVVARVRLADGTDVAVRIDRGPWRSTGHALAGANGAPRLRAFGSLAPNSPLTVELRGAAPNASATLILGLSRADLSFLGGTLVPSPDVVVSSLPTDANGELLLATAWPPGLPPGARIFLQSWVADAGAPGGAAASNGVEGTIP
ncbi:MAG: hypothetical protein ACF8XB_05570 [Planctomycetota bacterium JB042]